MKLDAELKKGMAVVDKIYTDGYTLENLNGILRIAQYASRLAASMGTAILANGDKDERQDDNSSL